MSTILLVRHGQASFGDENYDKLSPLGATQAKLLGQHYANLQRPIHQIVSGTLVRQIDSAQLFYAAYSQYGTVLKPKSYPQELYPQTPHLQDLPIQDLSKQALPEKEKQEDGLAYGQDNMHYRLDAFNEFYHEDIFIKSDPAFADRDYIKTLIAKAPNPKQYLAQLFNTAMLRWYGNEHADDYLESWQMFNDRVHAGLDVIVAKLIELRDNSAQNNAKSDTSTVELCTVASNLSKATDPTIMVFTSGGVIATITAQLMHGDSLLAYQLNQSLVNCGVTTLSVNANNELGLRAFNEHSHLLADGHNRLTRR